jgi:putative ABC transport system permease protein
MNWNHRIHTAFAEPPEDDVIEELAQHAAAIYASARADGCDVAEAERRVEIQIAAWTANPSLLRRRAGREPAVVPPGGAARPLASIVQDARYAVRLLGKQRAYTALVVATMALGVAATTVVGSVAYGVLLKPLPWASAPRLVRLYETRQGSTKRFRPLMTNAVYAQWRDHTSTLDAIAAWSVDTVTVADSAPPERIKIAEVTPSMLPMLEGAPVLGRTFAPGEEESGHAPAIILSYGFWQQRFGGAADVVGRTLRLEDTTYTVVGVMPRSFTFPDTATRAWVPFRIRPVVKPGTPGFSIQMFQAIGRLRPGATPAQAAAEGTARGRTAPSHTPVAIAVFGSDGAIDVTALPLLESMIAEVKPAIVILLAAVVLLLVTATANVASLQLARGTARRRELAIRTALGAGRGRLVRQTLVENLLLGLLGGAAGLALAALLHRALPFLLPPDFPRVADLTFDWRMPAFALALSVLGGLGCGLLPALAAARRDVVPALVEDALAPLGGGLRSGTARVRASIMSGQIAIASVLLVGALLLGRSFIGLLHADVGYDSSNVLTARLVLPDRSYTPERRLHVLEEIVGRLGATSGVTRAAYATVVPFGGPSLLSSFPLRKRDGSTQTIQTGSRQISAGYFAALGQPILEGREFAETDAGTQVVMVNREFARRYLEGRALGWTLPGNSSRSVPGQRAADRPIVGVVENTARQSVTDTAEPEIYFPARQQPILFDGVALIVRTAGDPRPFVPSLRAAVQAIAPDVPLESVMTMEDRMAATLARPRLYAALLAIFAGFALMIAGVGLFGVLSYTVALRGREIGVRAALGAQVRDIVGLVLRQSMAIAGAGLAAGLLASLWLTRALQKFLYGVTPHDLVSFAAVAALLIVVAAIASIIPARRAARVDPVAVLRG